MFYSTHYTVNGTFHIFKILCSLLPQFIYLFMQLYLFFSISKLESPWQSPPLLQCLVNLCNQNRMSKKKAKQFKFTAVWTTEYTQLIILIVLHPSIYMTIPRFMDLHTFFKKFVRLCVLKYKIMFPLEDCFVNYI